MLGDSIGSGERSARADSKERQSTPQKGLPRRSVDWSGQLPTRLDSPLRTADKTGGMLQRYRTISLLLLALALTLGLPGCGEEKEQAGQTIASDALVQRYADMILDGVDVDGFFIKAVRLDPQSGELCQLLIKTDEGLLTARRARFIVRAYDDTFSLKLMNVLVARGSSESSRLAALDSLTTSPVSVGMDVRDTLATLSDDALLSAAESE
jgi:hypothetical protein